MKSRWFINDHVMTYSYVVQAHRQADLRHLKSKWEAIFIAHSMQTTAAAAIKGSQWNRACFEV